MKNPKVRQVVLPLITALIWGSAFVTQSLSAAHLGCFSFNALRAIPAVLVLLVLLAVMQRIHPREKYSAEEKRALLRGGLVCGAFLALAINLQQFGMGTTSAGKAGFITALYIVLVPVFSTVLGKKAKKSIWLCVIAAVAGLYFLCFDGSSTLSFSSGDMYVFLSAFAFTAHLSAMIPETTKVSKNCWNTEPETIHLTPVCVKDTKNITTGTGIQHKSWPITTKHSVNIH